MNIKDFSYTQLHHTNICIGPRDVCIQDIDSYISICTKKVSHIERLLYEFDKFLLKDAKYIFSKHIHKIAKNEMQFVIIACNSINTETQNSILKILEEPPVGVYFFIIASSKKIFLQTILSRAQIFEYKKEIVLSETTKKFINSPYGDRLVFVKKILDELKLEKKTKQDVVDFVEEIEQHVHHSNQYEVLKKIIEIKSYIKDQGASVKQLLEYLALTI